MSLRVDSSLSIDSAQGVNFWVWCVKPFSYDFSVFFEIKLLHFGALFGSMPCVQLLGHCHVLCFLIEVVPFSAIWDVIPVGHSSIFLRFLLPIEVSLALVLWKWMFWSLLTRLQRVCPPGVFWILVPSCTFVFALSLLCRPESCWSLECFWPVQSRPTDMLDKHSLS